MHNKGKGKSGIVGGNICFTINNVKNETADDGGAEKLYRGKNEVRRKNNRLGPGPKMLHLCYACTLNSTIRVGTQGPYKLC